MSKIYFDAVREFKKYDTDKLSFEEYLRKQFKGILNDADALKMIIKISENVDFKTILAIVFNYCPSKYHPNDNYELTSLYIYLLVKGKISKREFNKLIGYKIL